MKNNFWNLRVKIIFWCSITSSLELANFINGRLFNLNLFLERIALLDPGTCMSMVLIIIENWISISSELFERIITFHVNYCTSIVKIVWWNEQVVCFANFLRNFREVTVLLLEFDTIEIIKISKFFFFRLQIVNQKLIMGEIKSIIFIPLFFNFLINLSKCFHDLNDSDALCPFKQLSHAFLWFSILKQRYKINSM